jgi:hypothetical protein
MTPSRAFSGCGGVRSRYNPVPSFNAPLLVWMRRSAEPDPSALQVTRPTALFALNSARLTPLLTPFCSADLMPSE